MSDEPLPSDRVSHIAHAVLKQGDPIASASRILVLWRATVSDSKALFAFC